MRPDEVAYWDTQANGRLRDGYLSDNWLKRTAMMGFLAQFNWVKEKVLEIGVGSGLTPAALKLLCGGMWQYIGTDLSPNFCEAAKHWGLDVVQGDVLELPEGPFSRILALDSLEHVNPEDRPKGYDNIAARLGKGGMLFINIPLSESGHKNGFDWGFSLLDLYELEKRGLKLDKYKVYVCRFKNTEKRYAMAILTK